MSKIFREIANMEKGDIYQINHNDMKIQIGRCFDGKTWLYSGFIVPEQLLYKNTNYLYTKKEVLNKVKKQLKGGIK